MDLPRDLIELFSAFADTDVRYLLVGGHAVAAHGRPRATKDVDLWLSPARANIERACRALRQFGLPGEIIEALRCAKPSDIVWIGRPPSRVDFLQSLPAVTFERCWSSRAEIEVDGVLVFVIGKADLIRNKEAVGRPQDRRDVKSLQSVPKAPAKRRASARRPKLDK
jgi:hypothetical protein